MIPKYIIIHSMSKEILYHSKTYTYKEWLCKLGLECHGFIFQDGNIEHWIDKDLRADHAGKSEWNGDTNLNSCSLGYEILIEGVNDWAGFKKAIAKPESFKDAVYVSLSKEVAKDCKRFNIPLHNILLHSDVSGDDVRGEGKGKIDAGSGFDYVRFINMVRAEMI